MMKLISIFLFRITGWKTAGVIPPVKKFVVIAAPHTSNMDFVYGMAAKFIFGVKIKYFGKQEIFKFPFGFIFRALGGIPIDRFSSHDRVAQAVHAFKNHDEFILALSPEGTRSYISEWKTGFYHIAAGAGVPILLCYLDYEKNVVGIGPTFYPTGNMEIDIEEIKTFYRKIKGRYPEKGVL